MHTKHCVSAIAVLLIFMTKVRAGEAHEEEHLLEDIDDVALRTYPQESSTAVPVQPMYPYPYNIYYPNPYTVMSPHMYNYQRSPYIQSPDTSPAGYTFKVTQKSTNNEEVPQHVDAQFPSPYQYNRPYHPFEVQSSDKQNFKQSLNQQPSSHTSFFQEQSVSVANNSDTPALNSNSISLQAYRWPSGEKPATKMIQSTMAFNTAGNAELTKQPVSLNLLPKTNSVVSETDSSGKIYNSNILSLNSDASKPTHSSEETSSDKRSEAMPVPAPLSEFLESNKFSSKADISGTDQQTRGDSAKEYVEKETLASENTLDDKKHQKGLSKTSVDVTKASESVRIGKEQTKQHLDVRDDAPNTLVVQISTVHHDKTIESPQIDPSGNLILFPISKLIHRSTSTIQQPQRNDNNSIRKAHVPVANEKNTQTGRKNKILNALTPNSKEEQENNTAQLLSLENESPNKQNKNQPAQTRNIIIRLPNGQELVIDLSRSGTGDPVNSSSGEDSGKFGLGDITSNHHISETALKDDSGIEEDKLLREKENNHAAIHEEDTAILTPKYSSTEQSNNLPSFNSAYNNENSPHPAHDFFRTSKDLESSNILQGSDNGIPGVTISNIEHFHHQHSHILEDLEGLRLL